MSLTLRALLLGGSFLAISTPVLAQVATAPPAPPAPPTSASAAGSPDTQVAEIVVTANKREQNLNKVGITITALSAEQLADRHIQSLADLAQAVPGLVYSPSTANTPIFTLRGVGFNEAALGVYPAVSVYLDQASLPFPVMASHSDFDLERVEVLKGPQRTLFGENSTGGAINYIAAKPTREFQAGGDVTYGRFNEVSGDLYVSGPLADNVQTRIAINGERRDDWQYSYTRPDTLGAINYVAARWLTNWQPTPWIRLSFDLNGWVDKSDPQALQYAVYQPDISGVKPALTAYPFSPLNPRVADWSTGPYRPQADREFVQAALRADIDVSPDLLLTSLTSYDIYSQKQVTDGDGYNLNNYDLAPNDGRISSVNQELRLANSHPDRFTWVVGGNTSTASPKRIRRFTSPTATCPARRP